MAVGIAMPFAVAVQGAITVLFTVYSPMMHRCDHFVDKLNFRGINRVNYLGMIILFCFYFIVAFLPVYFGSAMAKTFVEKSPQWLLDGLTVAGAMMPAIGFAMLMKIMLKKSYIAYFILGFLAVTYLNLPILAVALGALALALIVFFNRDRQDANSPKRPVSEVQDGI